MREFHYLNPGLNRDPEEVLTDVKENEIVVRNENNNRFIVLDRDDLFGYVESFPQASRNFHEVIFGDSPQKLKFDVDMTVDASKTAVISDVLDVFGVIYDPLEIQKKKAERVIAQLIGAIQDAFCLVYFPTDSVVLAHDNVVVCDSSGYKSGSVYKFSYHVIVDGYCVDSNREAKYFTSRVLELCDNETRKYVDTQVNSSVQNFRLVGCSKVNSDRVKRLVTNHTDDSTLISSVDDCHLLKKVAPSIKAEVARYSDDLYRKVIELCKDNGVTHGHVFRSANGSMLFFDRVKPTFCELCEETHHNDNTLMISIKEEDGAMTAVELCRHYKPVAGEKWKGKVFDVDTDDVTIHDLVKYTKSELLKKTVDQVVNPLNPSENTAPLSRDTKYNIYEEKFMRPYELVPTLIVKAEMGVGKTKALCDYVRSYFAEGMERKYIRFVTFRRTFSRAVKESFPDFTMYSSVRGPIVHNDCSKLIIQVESLHRINLESSPEKVDLLILDEVESVLEQFSSKLHRNISASFAVFEWMVRYAKHVICMDANVGRRTERMLRDLRGTFQPVFHWNKWKKSTDRTFVFTADKNCWFGHMVEDLKKGRKVVVPTNSINTAEAIETTLKKEFPDKTIQLYSSKTDQLEKNDHFGRVGEIWTTFDVMIYTPTVSAGISFEEDHFDIIYASFTNMSCNVETCRQMLGRVRSVRLNRVMVHVDARRQYLPTEFGEIKKFLINRRDILYSDVLSPQLPFSYDEDGQARYQESAFFNIWVETMCLDHLSKNDFTKRFVKQVADTGADIEYLADQTVSYPLERSTAHIEAVANANDVTDEEYDELRKRHEEGALAHTDIVQLEKYRLRETYSWWDREMDFNFVETYNSPSVLRIYKNLNRILGNPSMFDAVMEIQNVDRDRSDLIGMDDTKILTQKMVYHQHYYSFAFLSICGFSHIFDRQEHFHTFVVERLFGAKEFFTAHHHVYCTEFGLSVPVKHIGNEQDKKKYSKTVIKIINRILSTMYGIRIKWSRKFGKDMLVAIDTKKIESLFDFWDKHDLPKVPCSVKPIADSPAVTFIESLEENDG